VKTTAIIPLKKTIIKIQTTPPLNLQCIDLNRGGHGPVWDKS